MTHLDFLIISYPNFDPVALKIGSLVWIRWYGLAYVAGLLLGWLYIRRLVSAPKLWGGRPTLSLDQVDMLLIWVMAGVVLGGRLIGILLYDPTPYLADPVEIFRLWHGGMSFHGGLIGVAIALIIFSRRQALGLLVSADLVATAVPVGLFFGRIANFINGELWGRVSDVPWAMVFPNKDAGGLARHPSQLYEAGLEGLALGAVLFWLATQRGALAKPGLQTGVFLIGYGYARGFCEFFREGDDTWFFRSGIITSGMLYCVPMILIGFWLVRRAALVPTSTRSRLA